MGTSFCDDTLLLILSFLIDIWHGLWPWKFPLLKFIWVNIPICLEDSFGQGSFLNFIESPLLLFSCMLLVWWLAFWDVLVLFPSPNLFWTFSLPHLCCSYSIVIYSQEFLLSIRPCLGRVNFKSVQRLDCSRPFILSDSIHFHASAVEVGKPLPIPAAVTTLVCCAFQWVLAGYFGVLLFFGASGLHFGLGGETWLFRFCVNVVHRLLLLPSSCFVYFYVGIWEDPLPSFQAQDLNREKEDKRGRDQREPVLVAIWLILLDWVIYIWGHS